MIELVAIDVENFRSFGKARFEPAPLGDGMTAISGGNGVGKSSLVYAALWAFYGVTPDGVPVRALRRQGSTDPVVATVTFRHDGQTIEVTRQLRGKNDTTVAQIVVDGVQQTNISTRTATQWIERRLGLDVEGFLTAFVVRQKELDDLVTARPADRRKTIERLAGIERMSEALAQARQDARDAARTLATLPEPEDDPAELETQLQGLASKREELTDNHRSAVAAVTAAEDTLRRVETQMAAAEERAREYRDVVNQLGVAQADLRHAEATLADLRATAAYADDLPHAQAEVEDSDEALWAAETVVREVKAVTARAESLQEQASRLERDHADTVASAANVRRQLDAAQEELGRLPSNLAAQQQVAEAQISQLDAASGAAAHDITKLNASLTVLRGHDAPTCPTCEQHLPHPEAVITSLQDALQTAQQRRTAATEDLAAARDQLTDLARQSRRQQQLSATITHLTTQLSGADEATATVAARLQRADTEAVAAAEAAYAAERDADDARNRLPQLRAAVTASRRRLATAEHATATAAQIPDHETTVATLSGDVTTLTARRTALQADQANAADDTLPHQRSAAWQTVTDSRSHAARIEGELRLAERTHDDTQAAWQRATRAAEARAAALQDAERTTAVAAGLEEFRRDRLARLAPELSEVTSDFVARMTDGAYLLVELDDDFTPMVTDSAGVQRPAAWLSGGEESAVALALRVAIGEVLSGQRGGMLILDEVLTAQDATRRAATMAAIRELPRQTITINHVAEATDMVDYVVEVEPGPDGAVLEVHDKRGLTSPPSLD